MKKKIKIKGIAHITGGAFEEKIPRIIPKDKKFKIIKGNWQAPIIFMQIQRKGKISEPEMFRTFNMGIGMIIVIAPQDFVEAKKILLKRCIKSWVIGSVEKGNGGIEIV